MYINFFNLLIEIENIVQHKINIVQLHAPQSVSAHLHNTYVYWPTKLVYWSAMTTGVLVQKMVRNDGPFIYPGLDDLAVYLLNNINVIN